MNDVGRSYSQAWDRVHGAFWQDDLERMEYLTAAIRRPEYDRSEAGRSYICSVCGAAKRQAQGTRCLRCKNKDSCPVCHKPKWENQAVCPACRAAPPCCIICGAQKTSHQGVRCRACRCRDLCRCGRIKYRTTRCCSQCRARGDFD